MRRAGNLATFGDPQPPVALSSCIGQRIYVFSKGKGKVVKVTLVQALRVCTGRTAHRGSRGIALPFHDHDTRRG